MKKILNQLTNTLKEQGITSELCQCWCYTLKNDKGYPCGEAYTKNPNHPDIRDLNNEKYFYIKVSFEQYKKLINLGGTCNGLLTRWQRGLSRFGTGKAEEYDLIFWVSGPYNRRNLYEDSWETSKFGWTFEIGRYDVSFSHLVLIEGSTKELIY